MFQSFRSCRWRPLAAAFVVSLAVGLGVGAEAPTPAPARLTGRVTGERLAPLQGARVTLSRLDSSRRFEELTDAAGTFRVHLPPGRYRIAVSWRDLHASLDERLQFDADEDYLLDMPMVAPDDEPSSEATSRHDAKS